MLKYHFASDNTAGAAPEAWAALEEANDGYAPSYGEDSWTARASDLIREVFETDCEVFFTFNGTAAKEAPPGNCNPASRTGSPTQYTVRPACCQP